MPQRRAAHARQAQQDELGGGDAGDADTPAASAEQRAIEFLRRSMRANEHWRPSVAIAKCLGVQQAKLLLTQAKEDTTNLVWVTVLVLLYCTTRLADMHELWYEMADAAAAWLYQQPHFVEHREDLARSACALLGVHDASSVLLSLFPEPKDPETLALEAALGDWKICYLEQPPYSMYYWNSQTNESTWRNPIETAQQERERVEKLKIKQERLAKFLPQRVKINLDVRPPVPIRYCDECTRRQSADSAVASDPPTAPREASVQCLACNASYFCDDCCDAVHCDRAKQGHAAAGSFRFRACVGTQGFPDTRAKRAPLPQAPAVALVG